ncbi:hypothetical protein RRG08_045903 [Elysia crispata]|uniref:Uncharacterized protein n=1 Tax=Elysia crispata TaxID=231223 RepID=A0AAE1E2T9_9GAST|nr:hypothetical protein RRG08_045903 [Elysia crispata]
MSAKRADVAIASHSTRASIEQIRASPTIHGAVVQMLVIPRVPADYNFTALQVMPETAPSELNTAGSYHLSRINQFNDGTKRLQTVEEKRPELPGAMSRFFHCGSRINPFSVRARSGNPTFTSLPATRRHVTGMPGRIMTRQGASFESGCEHFILPVVVVVAMDGTLYDYYDDTEHGTLVTMSLKASLGCLEY